MGYPTRHFTKFNRGVNRKLHNVIEAIWTLLVDIEGVKSDPKNARSHPVRNLEEIKGRD